ncbi:MAG: hypothetical protein EU530_02495 [Promethearchaeota archaeon]|nr:MAG: hypothetical protein EU530_02495 [Candidatus Lokiarchaeota archaeon]
MEEHSTLDIDVDRAMLESVFDDPIIRYILLHMYLVRVHVFQNLEDDAIVDGFERLDRIGASSTTAKDLKQSLPEDVIEELFVYNLVKNISSYAVFEQTPDDTSVKLLSDEVYIEGEKVMFSSEGLLRIIKPYFPIVTLKKINDSLKKLRGIPCESSNITHALVHKFDEDFALDDELYEILFFLGNPFLSLRLERFVVDIELKTEELENSIDNYLKIYHSDMLNAKYMQKIKKAAEDPKINDIFEYLVSKSRNLPMKFNPPEKTEIYTQWKTTISQLLEMKSSFFDIHKQIEDIRSFYSGRKQKMSYFTFIEQLTENEEETSFFIRDSLLEIREKLKKSNDFLHTYSEKELKLLNLDLEREVIEFEEDDLD